MNLLMNPFRSYSSHSSSRNNRKRPLYEELESRHLLAVTTFHEVIQSWDTGYEANVQINNDTEDVAENWSLEFDFEHDINSIWNATIASQTLDHYEIAAPSWDLDLDPGEVASFGYIASFNGHVSYPANYQFQNFPVGNDPNPTGLPTISVSNRTFFEGDQTSNAANFLVSLSHATDQTVSVKYSTLSGTATVGNDFEATEGTLFWEPGTQTVSMPITIYGDQVAETDETFTLQLSEPYGASLANPNTMATIVDDDTPVADVPAVPTLSVLTDTMDAGGYHATFHIWAGMAATSWQLMENGQVVHSVSLAGDSPQSDTVHLNDRDYGTYVYQAIVHNEAGSSSSPEVIHTVGDASTIVLPAHEQGAQTLQLTLPQGTSEIALENLAQPNASFQVSTNNATVLDARIVNSATLQIEALSAGRASVLIEDSNTGEKRYLGVRVRTANGELPGIPDGMAIGSVSEDTTEDLNFWRDFDTDRTNKRIDIRYIYLNGGPFNGWRTWSDEDGGRLTSYLRESLKLGIVPYFVWYNIPDGGESYYTNQLHIEDVDYLEAYFTDLKFALDRIQEDAPDETVGFILEPDFLGYLMQNSDAAPAGISAVTSAAYTSGVLDPAIDPMFGNNVQGLVSAINYTISKYGPNVEFGWQFNLWSSPGIDVRIPSTGLMHLTDSMGIETGRSAIATEAAHIARYYIDAGILSYGADFVSIDKYGLDATGYQSDAAENPSSSTWFWNSDHWHNYLLFCEVLTKKTGLPVTLWQIPVGHINSSQLANPYDSSNSFDDLTNTARRYEDSAPTFFLGDTFQVSGARLDHFSQNKSADPQLTTSGSLVTWGSHLNAAEQAGINAILFGAGVGSSTDGVGSPPTDDFWWITKVQDHYLTQDQPAAPGPIFPLLSVDNTTVMETSLLPGDATGDGRVDAADFAVLSDHWLSSVSVSVAQGDFNSDGLVDSRDFALLSGHWLTQATPSVAELLVRLSAASEQSISVDFSTVNGTAIAGIDYLAHSGTVTFSPGETQAAIRVSLLTDNTVEEPETFFVQLTNPHAALIEEGQATATIMDDDLVDPPAQLPNIFVSDAGLVEGNPAAVVGGYLHTSGNQIVDVSGNPARISGVNWFGGETDTYAPHGLWSRNWKSMMDQMVEYGFNTIRLPFSQEMLREESTVNGIDFNLNPDLLGLTGIDIIDKIVDYAGQIDLRIILDHHRSSAGSGPNDSGLWYDNNYSELDWISNWEMLADRYANNPTVVGVDLHNEPHGPATWGTGDPLTDWRMAAEKAGNAVLAKNPHLLILVEGIQVSDTGTYWWGGNLSQAGERPVELAMPDRLVYSPHAYPAGVYEQSWFNDPSFPENQPEIWNQMWGYLYRDDIAPLMLGEFGSKLENPLDEPWIDKMVEYLSGDLNGDGTSNLQGDAQGISWTWWSWNPNSSDTGGILEDDWQNPRYDVLEKLDQITFSLLPTSKEEQTNEYTNLLFPVTLSAAATSPVSVDYRTEAGTATAGEDFFATNGTLVFSVGETTKTISVQVINDTVAEPDETIQLLLSNPTGADLGDPGAVGTIVNDDNLANPPGNPDPLTTLAISDVSHLEGDNGTSQAIFTVSLSSATDEVVTVNYATEDGTAMSDEDYQAKSGQVTFAIGDRSQTISITVNGDTLSEGDETFFVAFSNAMVGDVQAAGVILDDDTATSADTRIVGYFTAWGIYGRDYQVSDIPAEMLTHINYAFANISSDGEIQLGDSYADIDKFYEGDSWETGALRGNFNQLNKLKETHSHLQTLISIGGWTWSGRFSDVALTEASREKFVQSSVVFMDQYGFDGIDVDWEYPVSGGLPGNTTRPEDKENYTLLLQEFRHQLDELETITDKEYLLTIAAPATYANLELDQITTYLDWINVMTYDFHGSWSDMTNFNAALYASSTDPSKPVVRDQFNSDAAIDAYLAAGVPAEKLILGSPFYGRGWQGVTDQNGGLYQVHAGAAPGTWEPGMFDYHDLKENYLESSTRYWHEEAQVPWLYNPETGIMISYDDPESLRIKAEYVRDKQLGGMMFWELSGDDDQHSLLSSIYHVLNFPTTPLAMAQLTLNAIPGEPANDDTSLLPQPNDFAVLEEALSELTEQLTNPLTDELVYNLLTTENPLPELETGET